MQSATRVLGLIAMFSVVTPAFGEDKNPLSAVISLLKDLKAKVQKDGEDEENAYHKYFEWCDDTVHNTKFEIEIATKQKGKLSAKISDLSSDIEATSSKIEDLAAAISSAENDSKSATTVRTKEADNFATGEAELMETIGTLTRAMGILEREMENNPASFAQLDVTNAANVLQALNEIVVAASFSTSDRERLTALVQAQQNADESDPGAPAAATYKTHSSNIVDVLEDLKEKAEGQLSDLRSTEGKAKHNFKMLEASLKDQIAADQKDMAEQKEDKSAAEEAKANAEGDLEMTVKALAKATEALAATQASCMTIAADHEASVTSRVVELKVIDEATGVLESMTSGAEGQTYSFLQTAVHHHAELKGSRVLSMVKHLAEFHHSAALAQLASRIGAVARYGVANGADPFAKVKGLIETLIAKLEKEADQDATEKAYCDEQMAKTEAKKSELEEEVAKLTTKIDQAAAKSAGLKEEVKQLQAELVTLTKEQAEMDQIRQKENAAYVKAKTDLEQGLEGVRKALAVLREYYASKDEGEFLLQQPAMPKSHQKKEGAAASIIGILEVVESDMAVNLAKIETEESDEETSYEKDAQENKVERVTKEQDVKYKTQEFVSLDKAVGELSSDRESATTELSAVNEYYEKVKERCVAKPEAYEERKRRREAEIAGLKEALVVLENEAALVQRSRRGRRHHASFLVAQ